MEKQHTPKRTAPTDRAEECLLGSELNLPLVQRLTSIRPQSASRITWHTHDCYEILLLLDGSTAYEFRGLPAVELPGGHFMVIPPGTWHRGLHDVRRPVRLTGLMFDPTKSAHAANTSFLEPELAWLEKQFLTGAMQAKRMSSELRNLIKSLPREFSSFDPSQVSQVASLRLTVCAILLEAAKQLLLVRTTAPKLAVQAAIEFMKARQNDTCSIEAVAKAVRCSRAKLFEIFKESTGMTPNDYWQRLRIDRAQELLANSDLPIIHIALECGFSTSQYFSSVFRKYCGMSPSDYRQQHLNQTEG